MATLTTTLDHAGSGSAPDLSARASTGVRVVSRVCILGAALTVAVVLGLAIFIGRLSMGPLELDVIADEVRAGLGRAVGPTMRADISGVELEWVDGAPRIAVRNLVVRRQDGALVARAPRSYVGLSVSALVVGRFEPVTLDVRSPVVGLTIAADGTLQPGGPDPSFERLRVSPVFALLDPNLLGRPIGGGDAAKDIVLRRLVLDEVTITVRDERTGAVRSFDRFDVAFEKRGARTTATLASEGTRGRWTLTTDVDEAADGERRVAVRAENLVLGDLAGPDVGTLAGLVLRASADGTLAADGRLSAFTGRLGIAGDGAFEGPGWRAPIAPADVAFTFEPRRRTLELHSSAVRAGALGGNIRGTIGLPAAADPTQVVRLRMELTDVVVDREGTRVPEVERMTLEGAFEGRTRLLWVDRAEAHGADNVFARARGQLQYTHAVPGVRLDIASEALSAASAKRIWPHFIAPEAHQWFVENVVDGRVERASMSIQAPPGWLDGRPLQREMFRGEWHVTDGSLRAAPELPVITGVRGVIRSTAISTQVEAENGAMELPSGVVRLPTITFSADDMHLPTSAGVIEARAVGTAGALLEIGERGGVDLAAGGGFDPRVLTGNGDASVKITFPLRPGPEAPRETREVEASLTNMAGRGIFEGRDMERGTFTLKTDAEGFLTEGTALVGGIPVRLSARQAAGSRRMMLRAEVDTDDASRRRLGIELAPVVTGPATVRLLRELSGRDTTRRVEVDLTGARIAVPQAAFEKARGVPATIQATLRGDRRVTGLDDVVFQSRGVVVRGRVRLGEDNQPNLMELSEVRLRPDEQFAVRLERAEGRTNARVTGRAIDLRPFMRTVLSDDDGDVPAGRFELSLQVDRVIGHNGASINGMRLDLARVGPRIAEFTLAGSLGGATRITGQVLTDAGRPYMMVSTTDAGSVLRFLDLYRYMRGGRLSFTQTLTDPAGRRADGVIRIDDFRIVGDAGLQRLFGAAPPPPADRDGGGQQQRAPQQQGNDVPFEHMRVAFVRQPGVMQLTEGVLRNLSVGMTYEGSLNFRRQTVDIRGVFIPAYALNNILARIPIVGAFMGGANEGLIGVTYAVQGPLSGPNLQINPASAIAPGFLRHIFQAPTPGQATTPPASAQRPSN